MLTPTPFNLFRKLFGLSEPNSPSSSSDPWDFSGNNVSDSYYNSLELKSGLRPDYDFYEEMDCDEIVSSFVFDSEIALLDGTSAKIGDLVGKKDVWLYSCTPDGRVVPGLSRTGAVKTGEMVDVVLVTLDNGEVVTCTPCHLWMMRDGSYKKAKDLVSGSSLMPLYRRLSTYQEMIGYEEIQHPRDSSWQLTHQSVVWNVLGGYVGKGVGRRFCHHLDFNKRNNDPRNLKIVGEGEHRALHNTSEFRLIQWARPGFKEKMSPVFVQARKKVDKGKMAKRISDTWGSMSPEHLAKCREHISASKTLDVRQRTSDSLKQLYVDDPDLGTRHGPAISASKTVEVRVCTANAVARSWADPEYRKQRALNISVGRNAMLARKCAGLAQTTVPEDQRMVVNHKVVSVELAGKADVYDIDVDTYHNFALSAGVFVHNSVLDAYAEDSTQVNFEKNKTVWIESKNPDIVRILEKLFDDLSLEDIIYSIVRELAKHGNVFEGAVGGFDQGVTGLDSKDAKKVVRKEHVGSLKGFEIDGSKETLPPWSIVHFRLLSRNRKSPYGDSILWNARKIYRKIKWIEDAVVLYRLRRAPDRNIWYIDTGSAGPQEQFRIAQKWRRAVRKNVAQVDAGLKQDLRIMAADSDIFFPKNRESTSSIDKLAGSSNVGDIWDLEYFLNKLFGSLRAPKAYFGFEGDINAKASLVQQDFRFARGCVKLQRATLVGLAQLCQIHMAYTRVDPELPENQFTLRMSPVSFLEDQFRQELASTRVDTIDKLVDMGDKLGFSRDEWVNYVLKQFGGFTQEELDKFPLTQKEESLSKLVKDPEFSRKIALRLYESTNNGFCSDSLSTPYHIPKR